MLLLAGRNADSSPPTGLREYFTTFGAAENPLSEGGLWINGKTHGRDWNDIRTSGGNAHGNNNSGVIYADPIACLTGNWSANHEVTGTALRLASSANGHEIELHLRMNLRTGFCETYEVAWLSSPSQNPHFFVVKWRGTRATQLSHFRFLVQSSSADKRINDGDVLRADIRGNPPVIRAWKNGVLHGTWTDNNADRILSGAPGIGFNYSAPPYDTYGLKDFRAREI